MKKLMSIILTGIMAVTMIGGATVTAQAEVTEEYEARNVAEVVAFLKECHPDETMKFRAIDNVTFWYSWEYTDSKTVEAWMLMLDEEQKAELTEQLGEIGKTVDDLVGWHVEETMLRTEFWRL